MTTLVHLRDNVFGRNTPSHNLLCHLQLPLRFAVESVQIQRAKTQLIRANTGCTLIATSGRAWPQTRRLPELPVLRFKTNFFILFYFIYFNLKYLTVTQFYSINKI